MLLRGLSQQFHAELQSQAVADKFLLIEGLSFVLEPHSYFCSAIEVVFELHEIVVPFDQVAYVFHLTQHETNVNQVRL